MPDSPLSIRAQCDLLGVHRSGYYYCPKEAFSDTQLMNRIDEIHRRYACYGYRKIHHLLCLDGFVVNRKKVLRLMNEMGIKAIFPGPKTSMPGNAATVFPYLLNGLDIHSLKGPLDDFEITKQLFNKYPQLKTLEQANSTLDNFLLNARSTYFPQMVIGAAITSSMVLTTMVRYLNGDPIIKMPSIYHMDLVE